jgi:hypothetical protein
MKLEFEFSHSKSYFKSLCYTSFQKERNQIVFTMCNSSIATAKNSTSSVSYPNRHLFLVPIEVFSRPPSAQWFRSPGSSSLVTSQLPKATESSCSSLLEDHRGFYAHAEIWNPLVFSHTAIPNAKEAGKCSPARHPKKNMDTGELLRSLLQKARPKPFIQG